MKTKLNFTKRSHKWFSNTTVFRLLCSALILLSISVSVQAQKDTSTYSKPSWWFGVAGGANFNFYNGSTQKLNNDLTAPVAFHNGAGVGLFLGPMVEFHRPDSRWGIMLQAGYDSRRGKFKEVFSPCNCPRDLSTKLNYITIEPNLRFAPFKSKFYLFGGPRLAFNMSKSFTFKEKPNPDFPGQTTNPDVTGDISNMKQMLVSMQIGAGYDIPLSAAGKHTQFVLSPFVSFQPYLGQSPRTIETWTVTTLRAGAILKFGRGHKVPTPPESLPVGATEDSALFTVNSPKNIPAERRVRETFPLRNYVFFEVGSTEIPNRYVLLNKSQVKNFKEDQLEDFKPKNPSGRSNRQMVVYYNILNILGDRMQKNPSSTITLVGSSQEGPKDEKAMTESIKTYLVDVFEIAPSRINIAGRDKPKNPSEHAGATHELGLLKEDDRRVSIESGSPDLLMEFQTGPGAPLKPVEIVAVQEAPVDSYVSFSVAKDALTSWSLEITDDKGKVQYFGPYTQEKVSIPGKSILGTRPEGDYKVMLIGKTIKGKTVKKETNVHMVLWTPSVDEEGTRFSVIFEFNESKSTAVYEKYLTDIVAPKIPQGGTVIIHGYTDNIGDEAHNQQLSTDRANDVKNILEKGLSKAGRKDVSFEVHGFGEDQKLSLFDNKFPEERFYNRTVVIDIIPQKK